MASAFGHVAMRTRFQDWTCVRILMGPVATGHKLDPFIGYIVV